MAKRNVGIPRGRPYEGRDAEGFTQDHLGIYYGNDRGLFIKDVGMPVQPEVSDVRNPIGRKEKRHPGFRFDMWGQKGQGMK